MVKSLPSMWETQVQSLGQEDPLRRKWQSTLVFCLENPHGQRSLVGYNPWGHKELDMTEQLSTATKQQKLYKTTGLRCSKGVRVMKVKDDY